MANLIKRRAFLAGAPLALAACRGGEAIWAPDEQLRGKIYKSDGPRSITLYSMINTGSGNGAHSSLLIDASQTVMFDPAGSFKASVIPERNDVLFGISPRVEAFYISFHARDSYFVEGHRIEVSPAVAEQALRLVLSNGPEPKMACSLSSSRILKQLPGFETINTTLFPTKLRDQFAALPGVSVKRYYENDADDKTQAGKDIDAALSRQSQ